MPRERHLIVPLQQSASSGLSRGFGPRFVTGSHTIRLIFCEHFFYVSIFLTCILTHIFFSYTIQTLHGDIAQLVEHTAHIRDVIGPIPIIPTPIKSCSNAEQDFFYI